MKTQVLPITPESVALAARLLQQGELVALPTETVYGIAADARNGEAVKAPVEVEASRDSGTAPPSRSSCRRTRARLRWKFPFPT